VLAATPLVAEESLSVAATAEAPPLTVADAVAAALAAQPRLKAAETRGDAAAARTTLARLDRLGTAKATLLYTPWQKPLSVEFPGVEPYIPPLTFEVRQLATYAFNAAATVPLYTWGALSRRHDAARADEAATREEIRRATHETEFEARRAFYGAVAAEAAVRVVGKALDQQKAFLEIARRRMESGAVPRLDVLKAELGVRRAEATLGETANAARLARERLVTVTLDPRFRESPLRHDAFEAGALPAEADALETARASRPDLAALDRQAESLQLAARALDGAALPALAARADFTQQNDAVEDVLRYGSRIYQVGLVLSWDAADAKRNKVRAREVRANERGVRELAHAKRESVDLEVRSALYSAQEAADRVETERRALTVAEEQARVARLAYREGLSTAVEVQDAELALTSTEFALLRAALDLAGAQAQLRLALGD
jgi:outer membrane protein TolC